MSRLFKRFLSLTIITPKIDVVTRAPFFFEQQPNAVTITALEVKFKIEKNLGKHPNRSSVTVTNLAPATRSFLQKRPLIVRLAVGYDGSENLQHLFSGDVRIADTLHNGPHVDTVLEMGDGDRAFQFAHVSQSYAGSKVISAVSDTVKKLGLQVPVDLLQIPELQLPYTGTLHGPAQQALTELLTPAGVSWSMQDGRFVALKDTQVRENQAVVVRQADGMVGSPKISVSKRPGEAPTLRVKTLIDPRIVAGGKIAVRSEDVNGVFRVEKLEHTGDFRGKEWYTEIHAKHV